MPRRPRIQLDQVPLHIVQRGHNREACFLGEEDYQSYLHWLGEALAAYQSKGSATNISQFQTSLRLCHFNPLSQSRPAAWSCLPPLAKLAGYLSIETAVAQRLVLVERKSDIADGSVITAGVRSFNIIFSLTRLS